MLSCILTVLALVSALVTPTHAGIYDLVPYVPPLDFSSYNASISNVTKTYNISEPEPYNAFDAYFSWHIDNSGSSDVGSTTGLEFDHPNTVSASACDNNNSANNRIRTGNLRHYTDRKEK